MDEVSLPMKEQVLGLEVLLDPGLLVDKQVPAVARVPFIALTG